VRAGFDIQAGETVTIKQGMFGSYLLVTQGGVSTRVRRVE